MNAIISHLRKLEDRFERLSLQFQDVYAAVQKALQQVRDLQTAQTPATPGTSCTVWFCSAVAIGAGSSASGISVYALQGGFAITVNASATVYNQMAAATVSTSGKTIALGANGDGTFAVISQSC